MSKRGADELFTSPEAELNFKKIDTKDTPKKMDMSSDSQKVLDEIEDSAPEWFIRAFSHLATELKGIRKDLNGLQTFKIEVNQSLTSHDTKIAHLELKTQKQEDTIKSLQKQISKMETYSRQQNLLLDGISESPSEVLSEKVGEILTKELKVNGGNEIKFAKIHRLGKPPHLVSHPVSRPRPIIMRFESVADRDKVWRASWQVKEKKIHFSRRLPRHRKTEQETTPAMPESCQKGY